MDHILVIVKESNQSTEKVVGIKGWLGVGFRFSDMHQVFTIKINRFGVRILSLLYHVFLFFVYP